ncbi:MAG: vitamin B12-dependent ribonucleotide reductase [Firmicutes bacterium]|jgi:ribonucleoside-diphosphate reductase alpha chain|nr:vitamin B12-dependent ribonucleotide reductase [Bacillota bacterium]
MLKLTDNALTVLERRYLKRNNEGEIIETPEELFMRVAKAIAQVEESFGTPQEEIDQLAQTFYELMCNLDFLPNSPTLMNAGRELGQLSACFVLPVDDSMEAIFDAIKYAALIHKSGGGTGFSFSRLRPKNDMVSSTGGVASGPVSFMKVFNSATQAVIQGGKRRGANMGVLRVDHPDILEFIKAKTDEQELTNFNISVALTDKFMEALVKDEEYELVNPRTGEVAGTLSAKMVFDLIVEGAWKNGDPGVVFIDTVNKYNPTPQLGEIEGTNPCGEVPLLPFESCNLASLNLSRMVTDDGEIDWDKLARTTRILVRFLDNVIEANQYPLPQIEKQTKLSRKIGLGVMGFADMLIQLNIPYNSDEAVALAEKIMCFIQKEGREASVELGEIRGSFPAFPESIYADKYPALRNATVTTVAPTGTISIIAGCSSGIEPLFAVCYVRNVLDQDRLLEVHPIFAERIRQYGLYSKELMERVAAEGSIAHIDEIPQELKRIFVTAHDVDPLWHVKIQAAFQKGTDNAVSKTVNLPNSATVEDVREVYHLAYQTGCKGVTVYRDGSRESQVLEVAKKDKPKEVPSGRNTILPRKRPQVTHGSTYRVQTGCGNVYVTVNYDDEGLCEVFTQIGKAGGCAAAQAEAISRLVSLALRAGVKVEAIAKHLRGIRCPSPAWQSGEVICSCPDAIGRVLASTITGHDEACASDDLEDKLLNFQGACPECGSHMRHVDGCAVCIACGYSRCS